MGNLQSILSTIISHIGSIPPDCERALRLIDPADYILWKPDDSPSERYEFDILDRSWYAHALKHFDLKPGQRFLNIGSGSGCFSTVVGLLLGYTGTNHGIEHDERTIQGALERLEVIRQTSDAPLERDLCIPQFIQGNIFHLFDFTPTADESSGEDDTSSYPDSDSLPEYNNERSHVQPRSWFKCVKDIATTNKEVEQFHVSIGSSPLLAYTSGNVNGPDVHRWPMYDRIYVGAALRNRKQLKLILRLLNIGGILLVHIRLNFVKITRVAENRITWIKLYSLHVRPIRSAKNTKTVISLPATEIPSLLRLASRVVRSILRTQIEHRHSGPPRLQKRKNLKDPKSTVIDSEDASANSWSFSHGEVESTGNMYDVRANEQFESPSSFISQTEDLHSTVSLGIAKDRVRLITVNCTNEASEAAEDRRYDCPFKPFHRPASYYYREEMLSMLAGELHLPPNLIRAVFAL